MARISRTNRNFVIAYVLLVGVPLLGLAGVLKAGHALVAPISVDGSWTVETNTATSFGQSLQNSVLTVSQSGNGLVLGLTGLKTTGTGVLSGTAIDASLSPPEMAADHCGSDATLTLKAAIDSKAEPKTMLGTISVKGCATSDAELSYRAVRQSRSSTKKEAH